MADFHGTQEVVTDLREDGVLIMRINRPEKRNAINAVTSCRQLERTINGTKGREKG